MSRAIQIPLTFTLGLLLLASSIGADEQQERREPKRGPREEVAHRMEQIQKQLADATRAGKKEIADRLKQELGDYVRKSASEKVTAARKSAEQAVRQQIEVLEKKIRELSEQGQTEIAKGLKEQLQTLMRAGQEASQQAGQDRNDMVARRAQFLREMQKRGTAEKEPHRDIRRQVEVLREAEMADRIARMEREIVELHDHGQHEKAEQLERALASMVEEHRRERAPIDHEPGPGIEPREREELERRIHHLRAAAENLAAIGMHDQVRRLHGEADEIERTLHRPPQRGDDPHGGIMEAVHGEFRAIHQRLDELNEKLDRLARDLHQRNER